MSQAGIINTTGGIPPPAVPTSFVTNINSPSIPIANVENVFGGQVTTNNLNGIQTDGSSGSNTLTVQLTNRATGTATTVNVQTQNVITFTPPATEGVYDFTINICAWISAGQIGSTYQMLGAVKSNGAGVFATIGTPIRSMRGESATFDVSQVDVQILGGNILIQVTGLAGQTIKWTGLMTYVFGGA